MAAAIVAGVLSMPVTSAEAAINTCSGSGGSFAGGSGTSASPYLIASQGQLALINTSSYKACAFKLTQDISLSGTWTPIGTATGLAYFTGELDGNGHEVSNLSAISGSDWLGLFGYTSGAIIKDIRVSGSVNVPGGFIVGGLVGTADDNTLIQNAHSTVNVSGDGRLGSLVGFLAESTISKSSASGDVTGTSGGLGGLVGHARGGASKGLTARVSDSYSSGTVNGPAGYAGIASLIGSTQVETPGVIVQDSYATGAVTGGTGSRSECYDFFYPPMCFTRFGTTGGLTALENQANPPGATLTVTDSFWDTDTTGRMTTAEDKGTGKGTSEMKSRSTFANAGWDISTGWDTRKTWGICDGTTYPFLNSQHSTSPCPAPSPAPSPTPPPAPDASPSPSPSQEDPGEPDTPSPPGENAPRPATPSNAFTLNSPKPKGPGIFATVRVPGPGTLQLRVARSTNAAALVTACQRTKSVRRTGNVVLACTVNAATRAAQRRGSVRLTVTVTYNPTGGTARTSAPRTVVLKRLRPAYAG